MYSGKAHCSDKSYNLGEENNEKNILHWFHTCIWNKNSVNFQIKTVSIKQVRIIKKCYQDF